MIGIYQILNLTNNKRYIGLSTDLVRRAKQHKSCLLNNAHCNRHLQASFNISGLSKFVFNVLEECLREELSEKEIKWISLFGSYNNKYGYNMTRGGEYNLTNKGK